jgi:transposase
MKRIKFVGLDVHAETIAIAVAEQDGEIRSLGVIPNGEDSVRKLVRKLGPVEELRFCYEAGPTGYVLYWQLSKMGAKCEVVAPTLVPVKAGGSGEDGPAGCVETGEKLSGRRVDAGMGAGRSPRGIA